MLRALLELGIRPELVIGTSVGALNGVFVAADPTPAAVAQLADVWRGIAASDVFGGSLIGRIGTLARSGTHLHGNEPLRELLARHLPVELIEDLAVPFSCVAASIEQAKGHWFTSGPIVPAVLASAAVPGLLPPVEIGGEHFVDGGIVDSIPIGRAIKLGAQTIYVLQVGRIERPLEPPSKPWEVGLVAFELARRHRFAEAMAGIPEGVDVHVLPTGTEDPPRYNDLSNLRYRDSSRTAARIDRAYEASAAYLAELVRT
jgi:NTE family protein